MATINLGNIKFTWQGAYNAGTAYAIDDVVSYNGSSYVCIQASTGNLPTVTTHWNVMSSAGTNGTNGTDLTSTLTTQGDILYRDGSGLQRLAKGTAGQKLAINAGATAPEWVTADAGGKINQHKIGWAGASYGTSSTSWQDTMSVTITPTASNSTFNVWANLYLSNGGGTAYYKLVRRTGGSDTDVTSSEFTLNASSSAYNVTVGTAGGADAPNTTSAVEYMIRIKNAGGGHWTYINRPANAYLTIHATEILA